MVRICPKCGFERSGDDGLPADECPRCGVIYRKAMPRPEAQRDMCVAEIEAQENRHAPLYAPYILVALFFMVVFFSAITQEGFFLVVLTVGGIAAFFFYNKKKPAPRDADPFPGDTESTPEKKYHPPAISRYWDDIHHDVPVNSLLNIVYIDEKNEKTTRDIGVSYYDGSCYLQGHCHLRGAYRTFRIDRIQECFDIDTFETVTDIPGHLRRKYESSPKRILEKLYADEKNTLKVLYYVSKADGQTRREERDLLISAIEEMLWPKALPHAVIDKFIDKIELPSTHGFKLAVGKLKNEKPDSLPMVSDYAKRIVSTQKSIHPNEKEALDYIDKKIKEEEKRAKK
ncbi:WYL domain-containing protein [Desulfobotulus sp.]|uniref:WYL domain-containing protein n=1 Tax=Desulfobotulus sp. TaxID=1940337 RepID=UPI002A36B016|nr:WYL domain-containing protein [Desulfobotulus sp.]MDY0164515.1 WYL domain-containing protein [Desulfobotulus sp.]